MYEIVLKKNNTTRSLIVVETEIEAINFIAEKQASNVFGEPLSYTLEYSDISQELIFEAMLKKRKLKREFGLDLVDRISVLNESKSLTIEQIDAFNSIPLFVSLREHLSVGNIGTFTTKLSSSDVSAFFSTAQKNQILQLCVDFLAKIDE